MFSLLHFLVSLESHTPWEFNCGQCTSPQDKAKPHILVTVYKIQQGLNIVVTHFTGGEGGRGKVCTIIL